MDLGVYFFSTAYSIDISELAKELEQRGFESLLLPEHTHIPVSRKTPWPGGGDLPKEYYNTYDPFVALSFAAAATTTFALFLREIQLLRPSVWQVLIICPRVDSYLVLAVVGMWMKWKIMVPNIQTGLNS